MIIIHCEHNSLEINILTAECIVCGMIWYHDLNSGLFNIQINDKILKVN